MQFFAYPLYEFNSQCSDTALFAGRYCLLAVDGTVCTYSGYDTDDTYMPNTGNGVNQYHVNALYDLMNRTYADVIIQPNPQTNEQKACWQMAEKTKSSEHVIIIGDRGYGGMNLIEHLNRIENVDYLFRIKDHLCQLVMRLKNVFLCKRRSKMDPRQRKANKAEIACMGF